MTALRTARMAAVSGAAVFMIATAARADGDQAYLAIYAETTSMKMAGMAAPPGLANIKLPPGIKLPPQAANALRMFQPHRVLTVRLWSPGIAPEGAKAALSIPDGLKLGSRLDLELYRPKPTEGEATDSGGGGGKIDEMKILRYWGSSATVKPGQPEVFDFKGLTPDQQALMRAGAAKMRRTISYFYKPDWTTGYWPAQSQPSAIDDAATLPGRYALASTYTGNVELDVPQDVDFLAPIDMSSPKLEQVVNLGDSIVFRWSQIPHALGLHAMIFGMSEDTKTTTVWTSSEAKPDMGLRYDYLQMAEVRDLVSKDIVMAGDRADVTVPAGIFKDCDIVMFQMIGYGPGAATDKGQPLPRCQTKTTLNIMLGGKKMRQQSRGFGGDG